MSNICHVQEGSVLTSLNTEITFIAPSQKSVQP